MRKILVLGLAWAAWAVVALPASAGHHGGGCCAEGCGGPAPVSIRAEVSEQKYTVEAKVENPYLVKVREEVKDIPCTRLVPVQVADPHTGCGRTEFKQETVVEKVKVKFYEILPPERPCEIKKQDRFRRCAKVFISPLAAPGGPCCDP